MTILVESCTSTTILPRLPKCAKEPEVLCIITNDLCIPDGLVISIRYAPLTTNVSHPIVHNIL
ncbi:hypothetical protein BER93_15470 [Xanthomonas fragariae]|nr:hypothetical protein BER93_15470 [Xanthomonas fragariae]ENZ93693.1 hypothetical protein O1K_18801 [Xanthomonas fragariae LMG 25863]